MVFTLCKYGEVDIAVRFESGEVTEESLSEGDDDGFGGAADESTSSNILEEV